MMEASAAKEAAARTKAMIPATGNQLRHDSSREDSVETPKSPDVTNLDSTLGVQTDGGEGVWVSLKDMENFLMEDSEEEGALSPQPAAAPKRQKYHGSNPVCMRSGTQHRSIQAPDLSAVLPPDTPETVVNFRNGGVTVTSGVTVRAKRTEQEQEERRVKKKLERVEKKLPVCSALTWHPRDRRHTPWDWHGHSWCLCGSKAVGKVQMYVVTVDGGWLCVR